MQLEHYQHSDAAAPRLETQSTEGPGGPHVREPHAREPHERSGVWKFFSYKETLENQSEVWECRLCKKIYTVKQLTNLRTHIRGGPQGRRPCKKRHLAATLVPNEDLPSIWTATKAASSILNTSASSPQPDTFLKLITLFVITSRSPYTIVENPALRAAFRLANPHVVLPTADDMKELVDEYLRDGHIVGGGWDTAQALAETEKFSRNKRKRD